MLRISGDNPELGEVRKEDLEVEYDGEAIAGRLQPSLLHRHPDADDGRAGSSSELNGELDPGVIKPAEGNDYLGVVMPMRI